jgi:gliding motility-associated-like protein
MTSRLFFLLLLGSVAWKAHASHIVGGEIGMRFVRDNTYTFSLTVYYDALNGNPDVDDEKVTLSIFSKTTNQLIRQVSLPLLSDDPINYTVPACATGRRVLVGRFFYSADIALEPNQFAEARGYYIAWERCCRNRIINNILNPGSIGQAFYLEFPPLLRNGARFINSSPTLFLPVADYACANLPFTYNFGGTDSDGDRIVYSLRTPIRGFSSAAQGNVTPVNPGPYPDVRWAAGFGPTNMVPGNPALQINPTTGVLDVTPSSTGIFVFGVLAEEFRQGVKIGEVVREYQMVVLNCGSRPPVAGLEDPACPGVALTDRDTIYFQPDATSRCANVIVADPDVRTTITTVATPIGFALPAPLPAVPTVDLPDGGTGQTQVCFPECLPGLPASLRQAYSFDILVADNACPKPLTVRRRLNVVYLPRPNAPPRVRTSLANFDSARNEYAVSVSVNSALNFNVTATDPNSGQLDLTAAGLAELAGATFRAPFTGPSPVAGAFSWVPPCSVLAPGQDERLFAIQFSSGSAASCQGAGGVTTVRIRVRSGLPQGPQARRTVCGTDTLSLDPGPGYASYQWSGGQTTRAIRVVAPASGQSSYTVQVANVCGSSAQIEFRVKALRIAIQGERLLCPNATTTNRLQGPAGFVAYRWTNDQGQVLGTSPALDVGIGAYQLEVTDQDGCTASARAQVQACCEARVEIPSAFTPHNTPANNLFRVGHQWLAEFKVQIYNRWGVLVYESTEPEQGWDGQYRGQKAASGAYQVIVEYLGCDASKLRRRQIGVLYLLD